MFAGAILLVFIIVVLVVVFLRLRRTRRHKSGGSGPKYRPAASDDDGRRSNCPATTTNSSKELFYSDENLKIRGNVENQLNIPPTGASSPDDDRPPPPVPKRPVSYTPSVHDMAAAAAGTGAPPGGGGGGNLEVTSRNYGSAGDDLNNMATIAEFVVDSQKPLLDKSPPPPPRKLHSKSSNKRGWDPNINFPEGTPPCMLIVHVHFALSIYFYWVSVTSHVL